MKQQTKKEDAFICDAVRTPFGRYAGALSTIRPDDLGAIPLKELILRNPQVDWENIDDVIYGCANQAGEDNRNVARMSSLLAGLPITVGGITVNRLCGSGMDAVGMAARAIKSGESEMIIAGGVESMSRAPFVQLKTAAAFSRNIHIEDTTIGWRFINPQMENQYGVDSMPETAENVAEQFNISRIDQDDFALRSQQKAAKAIAAGIIAEEIVPVSIPMKKSEPLIVERDEHPRADTSADTLQKLKPIVKASGTVTAGNASGVNDGACVLLVSSEKKLNQYKLKPIARVVATATTGVEPRIMGIGPAPASKKVLQKAGLKIEQMDVIELNEAFASQALAVLRELKLDDDAEHVNPNGGAIALGHPLGASGARLITTAAYHLQRTQGRYALCTMCIGVGQGIAVILERV